MRLEMRLPQAHLQHWSPDCTIHLYLRQKQKVWRFSSRRVPRWKRTLCLSLEIWKEQCIWQCLSPNKRGVFQGTSWQHSIYPIPSPLFFFLISNIKLSSMAKFTSALKNNIIDPSLTALRKKTFPTPWFYSPRVQNYESPSLWHFVTAPPANSYTNQL